MKLNMRTPCALLMLALTLAMANGFNQQQPEPQSTPGASVTANYNNYQRSSIARFNRQHVPSAAVATTTASRTQNATHNCENLMIQMRDRVSVLATLNEDERNRLSTIDNKITQFESGNLARLDSLKAQQLNFLQQLESIELAQREMKLELHTLKGESDQMQMLKAIANDVENEANNTMRVTRQTAASLPSTANAPMSLNDTMKLDAIFQLITANSLSIRELAKGVADNLSRISQTTNNIQRRVNNLQRRVNSIGNSVGGGAYLPPAQVGPSPAQRNYITSCAADVQAINGILQLQLTPNSEPFYVLCDDKPGSDELGTGWTVIMNRFNGDVTFQRDWAEYKAGFGNLIGEFFIGLEKLHALTASAVNELLIVLEDFQGERRYARYNLFAIGSEQEAYALNVLGAYTGNAGDSFTYHAGYKFSTFDNDNDGCPDCNCAQGHMGAWWYNWCEQSNLLGKYFSENEQAPIYQGMYWHHFRGPKYSLKSAKMLIRPIAHTDYENRR